jgi:NitT/TauT family transport system substrate-binding protein
LKKWIATACTAALSAWLLQPLGAQAQALEKPEVSIAVGGRVALYYLPLNIADLKGYFKAEGLDVKVVDFQGGTKSVEALVGGSVDILSSSFEHMINLQARGQSVQAFVLQGRYPGFALSLLTPLAAKYKSPADLKGLKIGVTAPGSSTNLMLNLILKKAGMSPTDVSTIGVGAGAGALASLVNGQIDGEVEADPATTLAVMSGKAKVVLDTRNEEGTKAVYGGPMPGASMSATADFIKKNPKTIQALTNAMVHALQFLQTATDEQILDTLPASMLQGQSRESYLKMIAAVRPSYSPDGLISPAAAQTTLDTLSMENASLHSVDLSKTYTTQFVKSVPKKP